MTTKELNKKILESPYADLLNSLTFSINFLSGTVRFVGLEKIYDFIIKENYSWKNLTSKPSALDNNANFYNNFQLGLSRFIANINQSTSESNIQNYWRNYISDYHDISRYNKNIFKYSSPEVAFLLNVFTEKGNYVTNGAYSMLIVEATSYNDHQRAERIGEILAYEFLNKDSIISERKNKEKQALGKLRTDYIQELASAQTNLTEHIKEANSKISEFAQEIADLKTEKETSFDEWFQASKNEYLNFQDIERTNLISWIEEKQKKYSALIDSSTEKIDELERLYQEKLSLEAPVTYWNKRAAEMNKRGNWALGGLVGLIILSVIVLASFFFNAPIDALQKLLAGEAYGIKWMLTSITIISFLAYGMRSLNKLMFSSYHLARDAEERRKLTYVYLALKEQGAVDKDDRHIVLQSLFSRAETGLLKDESSPTMPSTVFDKFTSK